MMLSYKRSFSRKPSGVNEARFPTESQRALRASFLGLILGVVLATLARRRRVSPRRTG
jgi:hypothetical protein